MLHWAIGQLRSFASVECFWQDLATKDLRFMTIVGREGCSTIGHIRSKLESVASCGVGPGLLETEVGSKVTVMVFDQYSAAEMFPGVVV